MMMSNMHHPSVLTGLEKLKKHDSHFLAETQKRPHLETIILYS